MPVENKPETKMAFLLLYWTGMRIGELPALLLADLDVNEKTLSITKSFQRINGKNVITEPKTVKSKRVITLPDFLVEELAEYAGRLYGMMEHDRLFAITKSYLEKEMVRGVKLSGVKKIRLHDLRHSHASLLISKLGAQPNLVAERLGPSAWAKVVIEQRTALSGISKKDFITKSCLYSNIVIIGTMCKSREMEYSMCVRHSMMVKTWILIRYMKYRDYFVQ